MAGPLVELVVVVDAGAGLHAQRARPRAAVAATDRRPRGRGRTPPRSRPAARIAPRDRQAGARDEARLARGRLGVEAAPGAPRPGDAGEVDEPAARVDHPAALGGDQALPAAQPRPSASGRSIASRNPAAGAASGFRNRSRSSRRPGARGCTGGEAEVRRPPRSRSPRGELADRLGGAVARRRCRRRSARRRREAARPARAASLRTASRQSCVTMTTESAQLASACEDLGGVAEGLGVGDPAVAQLVDPDGAILDVAAPLGPPLGLATTITWLSSAPRTFSGVA